MEHVSTLCAISTVGIAATGFALGRVDRDSPGSARFQKKSPPLHDQCACAADSPLLPLAGDSHSGPPTVFATAARKDTLHFKSFHVSGDGSTSADHSQNPNHRRKSSLAGIILRRRGQTLSNPPPRVEGKLSTALHTRTPSSSWVRRLSFQPENRTSSRSPISPTSNGPTSPICSRPSSQRRAPNKLVKRPPSQPPSAHFQFACAPPSPTTTTTTTILSRRPATSHQRSDHLRHKATHSLNFEPSLLIDTPVPPTNTKTSADNITWQPYLTATHDALLDSLPRRLSTATKPKEHGLRRIIPSADRIPALLLAKSITNREHQTEVSPRETTPTFPVQFRDPFKPNNIPQEPEALLAPEESDRPPMVSVEDDPKSAIPTPGNTDAHKPRNTTLARPKRRAISTPIPTLAKSEGAIFISPRSHGRRNITDPNIFRRPLTSSHAAAFTMSGIVGPRRKIAPSYSHTNIGYFRNFGQRPMTSDGLALSGLQGSVRRHPKRHSIAASDPASTIIGSDDTHIFTSGDEDETDFLSDTAFDSIRTHTTSNSNPSLHPPRVETMFDREVPVSLTTEEFLHFKDLTPHHILGPQTFENNRHCSNQVLTPIPVSVPVLRGNDLHEEESSISFPSDLTDGEDVGGLGAAVPRGSIGQSRHLSISINGHKKANAGRDVFFAPNRPEIPLDLIKSDSHSLADEAFDFCPKLNIFDWSEQSRNDREVSGPDGRPRTVHGKHGPELRGSRASGRKAPNTLHLRSQSVPVSRDNAAPHETRQTSGKFGTWGLGSKGVSEDWDSDFEFDDTDESTISETMKTSKNVARRGMIVPQAIMECQASLHGQFGHVQELTLLVEELKRLRHQASFLGVARGTSNQLWKEAEGIVSLATLDDEENSHSPSGSPSSLTFSFDDSEEESANTTHPSKRASGDSWQASLSEKLQPNQTTADPNHGELPTKTNSVLDLIYQQRMSHNSSIIGSNLPQSKKLPFDTQSLRDLVIRAGVVTRALKEVIRKAEGVAPESDEAMHHSALPFNRIFNQSSNDSASTFGAHCIV
ncbi:hypothetical protein BDV28DRAFT_143173 [Aspergillus coremiiformis]|uniref:Uncharacterized protein n=1 Tax=Aspergillus coremiiformis TaxID=138285 RepID=A0A5N6YVB7_9EURO|nr:hypothetical protein BDV28DRAFT_143173 [Aspergillus coremiiformis]